MVSSVVRLVRVNGYTNQRVDQRSGGGRSHVGVQARHSPLGVDLLLEFGKQPGSWFTNSRDQEKTRHDTFRK